MTGKAGPCNISLFANRRAYIRHLCIKTSVLSCHRCLNDTGVEKMNNINDNFDPPEENLLFQQLF